MCIQHVHTACLYSMSLYGMSIRHAHAACLYSMSIQYVYPACLYDMSIRHVYKACIYSMSLYSMSLYSMSIHMTAHLCHTSAHMFDGGCLLHQGRTLSHHQSLHMLIRVCGTLVAEFCVPGAVEARPWRLIRQSNNSQTPR